MPYRRRSVVFAPPPCHSDPCQTSTLPHGISAGIDSNSAPNSGEWSARWLPGMIRVAPFASVKSVSAHIELHTVATCGLGSGITWSSAWIGCARSPGPIATEDIVDTRHSGSSTPSTIGRIAGSTAIDSNNGPWARRL